MLPDQRRQDAQVPGAELLRPMRPRQHLLEHQRVDVNLQFWSRCNASVTVGSTTIALGAGKWR
jgi:hypothetical protein